MAKFHHFAEDHLQKFQDYIEEAPHRIKVGCFAGGAAIVLNGLLSVIDVFDATRPDFFLGGGMEVCIQKEMKRTDMG